MAPSRKTEMARSKRTARRARTRTRSDASHETIMRTILRYGHAPENTAINKASGYLGRTMTAPAKQASKPERKHHVDGQKLCADITMDGCTTPQTMIVRTNLDTNTNMTHVRTLLRPTCCELSPPARSRTDPPGSFVLACSGSR